MNAKKVVLVLVLVFVGFWMFTDPSGLAESAKMAAAEGWDLLVTLFEGLIEFLGELS